MPFSSACLLYSPVLLLPLAERLSILGEHNTRMSSSREMKNACRQAHQASEWCGTVRCRAAFVLALACFILFFLQVLRWRTFDQGAWKDASR